MVTYYGDLANDRGAHARHNGLSGRQQLLLRGTALAREDLIPSGLWPDMDELHEEHVRLLTARAEAYEDIASLRGNFAAEDAAVEGAAERLARGEDATMPEVTPPNEREAAAAPVQKRVQALDEALAAFGNQLMATFEERESDWLADLDAKTAVAEEEVAEARRILDQAEAQVTQHRQVQEWIWRVAGHRFELKSPRLRLGTVAPVLVNNELKEVAS